MVVLRHTCSISLKNPTYVHNWRRGCNTFQWPSQQSVTWYSPNIIRWSVSDLPHYGHTLCHHDLYNSKTVQKFIRLSHFPQMSVFYHKKSDIRLPNQGLPPFITYKNQRQNHKNLTQTSEFWDFWSLKYAYNPPNLSLFTNFWGIITIQCESIY